MCYVVEIIKLNQPEVKYAIPKAPKQFITEVAEPIGMNLKESKRLVEICPQCLHGVNKSTTRLVSDTCGHKKCRMCFLQEAHGCMKCIGDSKKSLSTPDPQAQRKTVITSTLEAQSERYEKEPCQEFLRRTNENEILFPTVLVKKTKTNFHHFKRLISERYFSEGGCTKEDKACSTDPIDRSDLFLSLPRHIQFYCVIHNTNLGDQHILQDHIACSENDSDVFKCWKCGIFFENSYKLSKHNRSHTKSPKYQCNVCMKHFRDNYTLKTHARKHTGDKAFACHLCDVKFAQVTNLKRHIAKHKGEWNFVCKICNRRFLTKPELKRHFVSHSKTKAFTCRKCDAKFSFHRSLIRHAAAHNEVAAVLECNVCDTTFKRKDNLRRHIRNTHEDIEIGPEEKFDVTVATTQRMDKVQHSYEP